MDAEHIRELFGEFGDVQIKRLFGGAGLYAGGVMFGLVADGVIYLKADADTSSAFVREHCAPFQYQTRTGKRTLTSYWRLPDRLYDEPSELAQWAQSALSVAQAGKSKKRNKRPAKTGR